MAIKMKELIKDEPVIQKQFPYKQTTFEKDFKLYMTHLKNMMKLAEKKMK